MKQLATSVVIMAFLWPATAHAGTMTARTLSDARVGSSRHELAAQRTYSAAVVRAITHRGRWRYAPRHSTCWSHVPWARLCNRVRLRLNAQRWLYRVADRKWQRLYAPRPSYVGVSSSSLYGAFMCIHRYEGAWTGNTGNGYHGGLQMDSGFESTYGADYVTRWGGAENWPPAAQIEVAIRAYSSGRGFSPWPNTARACGLL